MRAGGGRRQGGGGLFVGPLSMCSFLVWGTVPAAAPLPTLSTVAAAGASRTPVGTQQPVYVILYRTAVL